MEVGAVKQAFNNELILLKKKMNQAKIQIIHKLTRKAKTLSQRKAPDHVKDKLSRKVESAVKEVLIIKKLAPKELAKFAVTHKGRLNDFLNKPNVDNDRACARLLLHKSLQDKYKMLRIRFSSLPIEELLMSREERRKLKKEEREKQKQKMKKDKDNVKKKSEVVNAEGEWDVEEMEMPDKLQINESCEDSDIETEQCQSQIEPNNEDQSEMVENISSNNEGSEENEETDVENSHDSESESSCINDIKKSKKILNSDIVNSDDKKSSMETSKFLKLKSNRNKNYDVDEENSSVNNKNKINKNNMLLKQDTRKGIERKVKSKPDKNRNLNEKLQSRKFKKDIIQNVPVQVQAKVVDPFFITSTGENYMSVAEPRAPDEIKEVHKQGNRKLRRAAMFGHTPNIKPRQDFKFNNSRFGGQRRVDGHNNTDTFNNSRNEFNSNNRNTINKRNQFSREEPDDTTKPEKLHPSWEAKKRQSGILPFQGKKIVFDES